MARRTAPIVKWTRKELEDAITDPNFAADLLERLGRGEAFVVEGYLSEGEVVSLRNRIFEFRRSRPADWAPLLDGCPDYHRINDRYPGSRVTGRFRVFHIHRWNSHADWFDRFEDVFGLKCALAGETLAKYWNNRPSDLVVPRLTVNHYPKGGGFLSAHTDPIDRFARVQTVVQLSTKGRDFDGGGVYFRHAADRPVIHLDDASRAGDLLLFSPGIEHGVSEIDSEANLDWESESGRLMIVPILQTSDYQAGDDARSKSIEGASGRE